MEKGHVDNGSGNIALVGKLDEFRTALQEEINAARAFESSNAVELRNGRQIAKLGKSYQYVFEIENALNLPGDTPGDLLVPDHPPLNVIIVSIEGSPRPFHAVHNNMAKKPIITATIITSTSVKPRFRACLSLMFLLAPTPERQPARWH